MAEKMLKIELKKSLIGRGEKQIATAAAHHIEIGEHVAVREHLRQCRAGHERHRNGTAQPIDHEDRQREQETISKLGDFPCVSECLEHLTSPQPFRLPSRFSLWQKQKRLRP